MEFGGNWRPVVRPEASAAGVKTGSRCPSIPTYDPGPRSRGVLPRNVSWPAQYLEPTGQAHVLDAGLLRSVLFPQALALNQPEL